MNWPALLIILAVVSTLLFMVSLCWIASRADRAMQNQFEHEQGRAWEQHQDELRMWAQAERDRLDMEKAVRSGKKIDGTRKATEEEGEVHGQCYLDWPKKNWRMRN